ncbi:MAG TPA: hypothetical protein VMW87_16920 [Spirochaetia bacterium]|nr:hypothetical protein [Spirochaetia bacterium]
MQFTGHSDYTKDEPPTFAIVGEKDGIADWRTMERRIEALQKRGAETMFHKYPKLGDGFGPGIGMSAEGWIEGAVAFWVRPISKDAEQFSVKSLRVRLRFPSARGRQSQKQSVVERA